MRAKRSLSASSVATWALALCFATVLSGCAATPVLGGGDNTQEMLPGLIYIDARTNLGPVNYGAVRRQWQELAEQACGKAPYKELRITETARLAEQGQVNNLTLTYHTTERWGYALCLDGRTSEADAEAYLEKNVAK